MPRPPEKPGAPLVAHLTVRCAPPLLAYLDSVRDNKSRGRYVRDLIRADALAKKEKP